MMRLSARQAGFSLIEMLLSVAIIGILAGLSLPIYETFIRRNDLEITAQTLSAAIRRAENYSRASKSDGVWGVSISGANAVVFQGASYATRTASLDESMAIPASITASGVSEVTFAKLTGNPSTTGTITLTSTANATRTITLNAKGTVTY
jgi:prepilin-type N-terminal cleavage/methylation domain-containing protein